MIRRPEYKKIIKGVYFCTEAITQKPLLFVNQLNVFKHIQLVSN